MPCFKCGQSAARTICPACYDKFHQIINAYKTVEYHVEMEDEHSRHAAHQTPIRRVYDSRS